jgi:hypothetical protein
VLSRTHWASLHFFSKYLDVKLIADLHFQNPEVYRILEKKTKTEGIEGSKAFFYAIWSPKNGLRDGIFVVDSNVLNRSTSTAPCAEKSTYSWKLSYFVG